MNELSVMLFVVVFFFSTDVIFLGIEFLWPLKDENFDSASDFVEQKQRSRSMREKNNLLVLTVILKLRYTFYFMLVAIEWMERERKSKQHTAHYIYSNCIIKKDDFFCICLSAEHSSASECVLIE